MASKQKRKIGVSKIGSTNKYVNVIKHFESNVPVGNELQNCELPERTFDINKDLTCTTKNQQVPGIKKKVIKFSSASKSMGETSRSIHGVSSDLAGTCLPATRASLRKRYPSLPPKFNRVQSYRNECGNFTSKSSKELTMNSLTKSYNNMKSVSESNALTTRSSFSVIVEGQQKNKGSHSTNRHYTTQTDKYKSSAQDVEIVPKRSTDRCKSKTVLEVFNEKNALETTTSSANIFDDDHRRLIPKLNEDVKDGHTKNKRRHLVELKTEIAEFRNNKGSSLQNANESVVNVTKRDCPIELKLQQNSASIIDLEKRNQELENLIPSTSKFNIEDVDMYDSVAFILQNRVIIPNSDEFGSYPVLPKKTVENKVQQFEIVDQQTDASEAEADVSEEEASLSGFSAFERQIGDLVTPMTLSGNRIDSETELNSKIEQNKMLINKVQKVLDIIKLGVQFPTTSLLDQDFKIKNTPSDVIFREAKSEVETAVHMYEEFNEEDIPLHVSISDVNMDEGIISNEDLQEEAAKSDVETAVRQLVLRETTSYDTFRPPSMADDDVMDAEELVKIEEILKQNELEDIKGDVNLNRPLTRRNEDVKWTEDKFRTEPVISDRYTVDMDDFDIVQAKLNTIHDTESESASDDMYIDPVTKEIPVSSEILDVHTNSLNTNAYNNNNVKNREEDLSESINKGNVDENKSDIRIEYPFKSRIIDEDLRYNSDRKDQEWMFKNKPISKMDDSKQFGNKNLTSIRFNESTNYIDLYQKSKKNRDVATNTIHSTRYKDTACTTDDSGRGTDFTCNTEITKSRDAASNTYQPAKLKNTATITDNSEKIHVASNTECKRNDFSSITRPQQKDFACKADLRKCSRDVICDTDYLKKKTTNATCYTDHIRTSPVATQKCRLDGIHMTFESVENINIPSNNHLKKSDVLQVQLLPSINISSLPTVQRILHFYIDKYGESHVSYQPSIKSIAYVEVRSPSYNTEREVTGKTTSTIIDERNYGHGFREIQKVEPSTLPRSPRRKCKFFIDHKYNPNYESGSETDKMIRASSTKSRYQNLCKIGVCSGDDGEFFIEAKSALETQMYEDGTMMYLTKYGTYLKRTCSDSSIALKTIKGASAHALVSDSETNSRMESVPESNKICSKKTVYSSGNSSQWVGEFMNQNIDEKVYKTYINPDGFSKRHNRWKYATEKAQTNLECFAKQSSREHNKSSKTIETQTLPWCPESVSKSTTASSFLSDQTIQNDPELISTSYQSHHQQKLQTVNPEIGMKIQNSVQLSTKTQCSNYSPIKKIVNNSNATCVNNFSPNLTKFSHAIPVQEHEETHNYSEGHKINMENTSDSIKGEDKDKNQCISLDKISLTVTCSTDESSMKPSSFVLANISTGDTNTSTKKSEKIPRNVKHKNVKKEEIDILQKDQKYVTEYKNKKRNHEEFSFDKKRRIENDLLSERKTKKYQSSKEIEYINKRTIPIVGNMLQDDSILVKTKKKHQDSHNRIKERNNLLVDDIINKFRNVYMIDTDGTRDTSDRSLSEGEIRCYCSTSTGEIHDCKKTIQKPRLFQKDIGIAPIKKRRNYLNNWTTYYFNKYSLINDSSSTS